MAKRGRPRKQRDVEDAIDESTGEEARKNSELTEDERHALHLRHCREYELVLAAKKTADAAMKNCGKRIKAEDDSVTKVKQTLKARTPEGEAELRKAMAETAEVLRWAGVNVGDNADLFPEDRTPGVDRAFVEGKRAGLAGEPARSPHDSSVPQHEAWMNGWRQGQDALMSAFQKKPEADEHANGNGAAETPPAKEVEPQSITDRPFAPPPDEMPTAPVAPAA